MYGGQHDPELKPNKFFSKSVSDIGWKYYYEGDLDTAIKRFNQAWMFDRESVDAFWGFGPRILFQKAEKLEKNYLLIYSNWSVLEFYEGNYSAAKSRLDFAKKLGFKPDPNYEKELKEKLK